MPGVWGERSCRHSRIVWMRDWLARHGVCRYARCHVHRFVCRPIVYSTMPPSACPFVHLIVCLFAYLSACLTVG